MWVKNALLYEKTLAFSRGFCYNISVTVVRGWEYAHWEIPFPAAVPSANDLSIL